MVTAIPGSSTSFQPASTTKQTEYCWFKMPDLNRATHRRLGQSGAGWTFETICRLVHHVGRVGRPQARKAAKELGRLGVGLQSIADEAGVSVAKIRRDLVHLVNIGVVAVSRRNVTFITDPATGKIVENRTGRSLPVIVFLTVGPEHLRTKAGQANRSNPAPANPSNPAGPPPQDRDHSGGAIQRELNTERVPDGLATGVGQPQAGKKGGHPAAETGQEGGTVRVDDPHNGLPVPIGRISRPAGKSQEPRRSFARQEGDRKPEAWTGRDADAYVATMRRLEAERQAREAQDAAWRAAADAAEKAVQG